VVFLAIHPFQDSNGRLSRVLTGLLLLQAGYLYVPYSSLESVIEQNKESYYLALRRTQGTLKHTDPDWAPWITFFLTGLQRQKDRLTEKIASEHLMAVTLPPLAIRILEVVRQHGRVAAPDIARVTAAPRGTIKKRLTELVQSGLLIRRGKAKATWYQLP
jgi:Fic family protein